nr:MAG TPA: DnaJ-like protein [Caudoviricetes sp.]
MSKIARRIELRPPSVKTTEERIVSKGHDCEYCQGNGYFVGYNRAGQSENDPCPICGGSGKVDAVVTIEWKAAESI